MTETRRDYQSFSSEPRGRENALGKNFFVILSGNTNGAHRQIVEMFRGEGQTEVTSDDQCDYLLVFCPVASRVGTDIIAALDNIPAGKPAVLVVMHHTFDRDHVVAGSRRLVQNPNILLTVDCLFHKNELLQCDLNNQMQSEITNFLGVSQASLCQDCVGRMMKRQMLILFVVLALVIVIVIVSVLVGMR